MAKKDKNTPKAKLTLGKDIDKNAPDNIENIDMALRLFNGMPKELQDFLMTLSEYLNEMPEDEREKLLESLEQMEEFSDEDEDYEDEDDDDEDEDYEDEDDDLDKYDYPYFLPRPEVHKYTLRVTLRGLKPAIYRKFNVPSNISLRHLSELLLPLMGWEGYHLNQFRKGYNYYAPAYQRDNEMPISFGSAQNFNQEDYTLSDILSEKGKSIEWEYDFGDSWYHDVKLSSIGDYSEGEPRISFIKGERACPPEDCGSIWGYMGLLELHAKLKARKRLTKEEKDHLEWFDMDKDFDPAEFDAELAKGYCDDFCE